MRLKTKIDRRKDTNKYRKGDRNKERCKNRKKDGKRTEDTKDTKERQTDRLNPHFDKIVTYFFIILHVINSNFSLDQPMSKIVKILVPDFPCLTRLN